MRPQTRKAIQTLIGAAAFLLLSPIGAYALTISPPTMDFDVNPGDTILDVVRVYNEGTTPETLYPMLVNFSASGDESGNPTMVPPDTDVGGTGLAAWITIAKTGITVQPDERINFPFSINVPKDAQPGGHYGSILLSSVPAGQVDSGVGVSSQLGTLLLVNVSGQVRESGSIAEFGFKEPRVWYNHLPIDFFLRFENSGNTHLRPSGNLFIKDWMGRQVASIKVNEGFNSVLPLSIRRFAFGWQKAGFRDEDTDLMREWNNFGFGRYTATLVLNYGRGTSQLVTEERTFYVWPWRIMLIAAGGLVLLLILLTIVMRSYNRALIKRYEKSKKS